MINVLLISEASKKVDLPVATIRYYADLNMIPSIKRNYKGQRVFDDESITWLEGIKFLRELNMPIPEIQKYIELCQKNGLAALKKRHAILSQQEKIAEALVADDQNKLKKLKSRLKLEEEIIKGHKQDSLSAARRFNQ